MENSRNAEPVDYPTLHLLARSGGCQSHPLLRIPRHRIEDDLDRHFIAHAGINHQVETMPPGPVDVEISLDEVRAVAVHRLRQFLRFLLAFAC